jgi:hypothetical protein
MRSVGFDAENRLYLFALTVPHADQIARGRDLAARRGIHLLSDDGPILGGIRFLGSTLWADMRLNAWSLKDIDHELGELVCVAGGAWAMRFSYWAIELMIFARLVLSVVTMRISVVAPQR